MSQPFMLQPTTKPFALIVLGILITLMMGCVSNQKLVKNDDIIIESVNSKSTVITHTYLSVTDNVTVLHGELTRRVPMRGQIPGHLHIELINPENEVIKTADISYKRKNRQSQQSQFNLELPISIVPGSVIRITHHDLLSHMSEPPSSPWQDVDANKGHQHQHEHQHVEID